MSRCQKFRKDWPAYVSGELEPDRMREMRGHLQECSSCQKEVEQMKAIFSLADDFRSEMQQVMTTVDWDSLPSVITERVWDRQGEREQKVKPSLRLGWKWQPLAAGLLLGLLLGIFMTYILFRPQAPGRLEARRDSNINLPADFVDRVDVALARRETIDYLERSQYLILELLQPGKPEEASSLLSRDKIRQLLTDKKYLNNQLEDIKLLKAKAICDQIELLFLELSQLSPELSAAEMEKVRKMIEDKQLLLKINLVKKELQQSEV